MEKKGRAEGGNTRAVRKKDDGFLSQGAWDK